MKSYRSTSISVGNLAIICLTALVACSGSQRPTALVGPVPLSASLALAPSDGSLLVFRTADNKWHTEYLPADVVTGLVPSGTIVAYGGSAAPSGWGLCGGAEFLRSLPLYGAIGTTYGVGNGSTTANLPDLRQRFPLGKATSGTGSTLGGTGGAIDHKHGSPLTTGTPSATVQATILTGGAGSPTHTHAVIVPTDNPPFAVVNYLIKY